MSLISRRSVLQALAAQALAGRAAFGQTRVHRKPKPLSKEATTHDWAAFLGPSHNATSTETRLSRTLPPPLVWEFPKGTGYTSPAIAGRASRVPASTRRTRRSSSACTRKPGRASGSSDIRPRSRIATATTTARGRARSSTASASTRWAPKGSCIASSLASGKVVVEARPAGGVQGAAGFLRDRIDAAGGRPAADRQRRRAGRTVRRGARQGDGARGLARGQGVGTELRFAGAGGDARQAPRVRVCRRRVESADRRADVDRSGDGPRGFRRFRGAAARYESVNASCPVVFDNKVFISASYRTGSALVEVRPDFTHRVVWTTQEFGLHFNTAIYRDGYLYGFDGRNEPDASLACVDAATGKVVWRETPEWTETFELRGTRRQQVLGTYRGSLLAVDGQFLCLGELGHLLWMDLTPKGYTASVAGLAVRGARVVGASGAQPRPAVRRAEHARHARAGPVRGCSATTCGRSPLSPRFSVASGNPREARISLNML